MRLMMTQEMKTLYYEIKPYFDFTQPNGLKVDTPDSIREKAVRYDELRDAQSREVEKIEGIQR